MRNKEFYGIYLLKIVMAFEVILNHFWYIGGGSNYDIFRIMKPWAVPVFMTVSFFCMRSTYQMSVISQFSAIFVIQFSLIKVQKKQPKLQFYDI